MSQSIERRLQALEGLAGPDVVVVTTGVPRGHPSGSLSVGDAVEPVGPEGQEVALRHLLARVGQVRGVVIREP